MERLRQRSVFKGGRNMKGNSQADRLLNYLQTHAGITPDVAYTKLGIYRLSARVFDLRDKGYKILTTMIPVKSKFNGEEVYVARYSLVKESL